MNKKRKDIYFLPFNLLSMRSGSILIVSLWILTIFVVLVLSLGYRSNIEAKLSLREQEYFQAEQLLFSGVNFAYYYIVSDEDTSVDSKFDTWYNHIEFSDDVWESNDLSINIFDEESKININQANDKTLRYLFEYIDEEIHELNAPVEDIVEAILLWRGEEALKDKHKGASDVKSEPFDSIYELLLVKDINYYDFTIIKDYLTVCSNDKNFLKINPNTASEAALYAVIFSLAGDERHKKDIFEKLVAFRTSAEKLLGSEIEEEEELPYFTSNDLSPYNFLNRIGVSSDVLSVSLALQFIRHLTVDSKNFYVTVTAFSDDNLPLRSVRAVLVPSESKTGSLDKENELKIFSWFEAN